MDIVPHIQHLNGLHIEFLKMHIDVEPSTAPSSLALPPTNGHVYGGPPYVEGNNNLPAGPNGLQNGYSHQRPSTYV